MGTVEVLDIANMFSPGCADVCVTQVLQIIPILSNL